jgi:hypothetical protein
VMPNASPSMITPFGAACAAGEASACSHICALAIALSFF